MSKPIKKVLSGFMPGRKKYEVTDTYDFMERRMAENGPKPLGEPQAKFGVARVFPLPVPKEQALADDAPRPVRDVWSADKAHENHMDVATRMGDRRSAADTRRIVIPKSYVMAKNDEKMQVRVPTPEAMAAAKAGENRPWPSVYLPTGSVRELTPEEAPPGVGGQFYVFETKADAVESTESYKDDFNMSRQKPFSVSQLDSTMKVVADLSVAPSSSYSKYLLDMSPEQTDMLATSRRGDSLNVLQFAAVTGRSALQQQLEDSWRTYYERTGEEVNPDMISYEDMAPDYQDMQERRKSTGFAVTDISGFEDFPVRDAAHPVLAADKEDIPLKSGPDPYGPELNGEYGGLTAKSPIADYAAVGQNVSGKTMSEGAVPRARRNSHELDGKMRDIEAGSKDHGGADYESNGFAG